MKLVFNSHTMQGNTDEPFATLTRVEVSPVAEDNKEVVLLQLLRQQPELLVFTLSDIRGEWQLKRRSKSYER